MTDLSKKVKKRKYTNIDPQAPDIRGMIRDHKQKKNQNSSQLDHRTLLQTLIARNQFIRKPNRKPKKKILKWHISIQTTCTPAPCSQSVFFSSSWKVHTGQRELVVIRSGFCKKETGLSGIISFIVKLDFRNSLQLSKDEMPFLLFKDPVCTAQ